MLLGEPIYELRQFWKDISFRNGHERKHGELDLLDRRLELAAKHGLLETPQGRSAFADALAAPRSSAAPRAARRRELRRGPT